MSGGSDVDWRDRAYSRIMSNDDTLSAGPVPDPVLAMLAELTEVEGEPVELVLNIGGQLVRGRTIKFASWLRAVRDALSGSNPSAGGTRYTSAILVPIEELELTEPNRVVPGFLHIEDVEAPPAESGEASEIVQRYWRIRIADVGAWSFEA